MSALVPITAVLVLGLIGVYVAVLGISAVLDIVRGNRLLETERVLLEARIEQLRDRVARLDPQSGASAWAGSRKFLVVGKVLEAEDVCSFYLAPHDGQALPPYLPGQFLTFRIAVPDPDRALTRCYSLSDSPTHPDYYRITIKRLRGGEPAAQAPDGVVSTRFHHEVAPDDLLDVRAPSGHFHLDVEQPSPVVLIAGGIGVTPILSMLNYIAASGSKRETWLFYGVRHGGQHLMKQHLGALAAEHDNVRLHVCYSAPRPADRKGLDYDHAERVSVDLLRRLLPSSNYDFYTCGPPPMMEQITRELGAWGVPGSRIHIEAFGAATVKQVGKDVTSRSTEATVRVEFARSGRTLQWDGSAGSLLELAEAGGVPMESGCRAGNCGSCLTAIRSGAVEYLSEPGAPVEDGSCLACITVPRGPLVLDA